MPDAEIEPPEVHSMNGLLDSANQGLQHMKDITLRPCVREEHANNDGFPTAKAPVFTSTVEPHIFSFQLTSTQF